jgi:hypothetical protein
MNAGDAQAHEIDTSPNIVLRSGVLKAPENGSGNRSIASDAGEHAMPMHGAGVHDFEPPSMAQVVSGRTVGTPGDSFHFTDENLGSKGLGVIGTHGPLAISEGGETPGTLGDSFHFKDEISSPKGSGLIDVADQTPASIVHHDDGAATHVPPAIELPPLGQHPDDHFDIVPDHVPSHLVTHVPHDLIV